MIRLIRDVLRFVAGTTTVLAIFAFLIISNTPGKTSDQILFDGFALSLVPLIFISAYRLFDKSVKESDDYLSMSRSEQLLVDLRRSGFWPTIGRFIRGTFILFCLVITLILASGFFL